MTLAQTLRNVPLLSQLRDTDLEMLSGMLTPRDYPKNRVILFAHDAPDAFYLVLSGQVKVMLIAEDGREVVLSLVGAGDFFGELVLMDDEIYSTSVIAMEDSRLLALHRDHFRRCIAEIPGMSFGLLRALCGRLREADEKIGGLMLLDVAGRVSQLLLEMSVRAGSNQLTNVPTHQVIAQMVGSSRETVSRTISSLAAQGFIEASRGGITILNPEGLESVSGHILRRRYKSPGQRRRAAEAGAGAG